ncbi:MAG: 50S ribosomal protein L24 [candidate division TM6 bacterium GW2011_GWF2_32_72]|nr:MAG: 50S ribosomal protein L24 [candidate division TM6 bacterium GW2011_GWF2_32_72]
MMRIKKNDTVVIIAGKDKGKEGSVLNVSDIKDKVLVKGLGIVTKHVKAKRQGEVSGIKEVETLIEMSKVLPVCPFCKKGCRVNSQTLDNGKRARVCNRCKKVI